MKITTSELVGPVLDWAVAKAGGIDSRNPSFTPGRGFCIDGGDRYSPSTNWAQGGPIVEREKICVLTLVNGHEWGAKGYHNYSYGSTPLVAAMRCFVVSKLGLEVEIPDMLANAA